MPTSVITLRLDAQLKKRLDHLSRATSRSRSFLAVEAIREYVALNDWQIEEIKKGIQEADAGEFASQQELDRFVKKWKRRVH